ncbi:MAG TPA: sialidase family protein [Acidimicrobiales bacterium]|nr:sialidase family protein [Acidimicrobiales bacterium]
MKRSTRRVALVGVALVLGAQGSVEAADPVRVTAPVQATKFDTVPARQYGTPDIAVDPENPLNVVATLPEVATKHCGLMRSTDGGVTWRRLEASPSPPSYPFCLMQGNSNVTQGLVAFGRNHTLYYLLDGWDTQDGDENGSVFVGRSTDFGETWATTMVRDNRAFSNPKERDRPISGLAVDRRTGKDDVVAVSWRWDPVGLESPNAAPIAPMISVSTDGAKTFPPAVNLAASAFEQAGLRADALKPVPTTAAPASPSTTAAAEPTTTTLPPAGSKAAQPNQVANFGGSNPSVAIDRKGTIYAAWVSTSANISPAPPFAHFLSKSTDKGKTWTVTQISPFSPNNTNGYNALHLVWSPAGGPDGSLHFVYEGSDRPKVANFVQVLYRRSTDGGKTWSEAQVLNDTDPAKLTYAGDPNISVAPNGRIDATWWDTRNDPGIAANDVFYTSSSDAGVTWSGNVRVTDRLIDRKIGVYANNYDVAGPPAIASTDAYAIFGWDDTRNGDAVLNTQDIFIGSVQYKAIGTTVSSTVTYALAAVLGVLAVGVVLLVAAVVSRRRDDDQMPRPKTVSERALVR